jgi:hypothetical protein
MAAPDAPAPGSYAPWGTSFAAAAAVRATHTSRAPARLMLGPLSVPPDADRVTCSVATTRERHAGVVWASVAVLDERGASTAAHDVCLRFGDVVPVTLPLAPTFARRIRVSVTAFASGMHDADARAALDVKHVLAYRGNRLVDLFNAVRSDKGTERGAGEGAPPHAYAVDYFRLFEHLQEDDSNVLEIGLDIASKDHGRPSDAPSLRAWRQFLPKARLFGYDIHDFSFFTQERTTIFRGDQSSRRDLCRFLQEHHGPRFRLIIDDGSHASSHQQISLATLFPHLEPGALYVVEDLGWQPFPEAPTTLDLLARFQQTGRIETPFLSPEERSALERAIARVEIHKPNDCEFAVIYKRR